MPTNVKVRFNRGTLANMPANKVDGSIYITTDEGAMYVDNGSQRIRLGDFVPVNTVSDLPAAGHAYETAVYYVREGNILARWDKTNSRWVQINKAGVVGITNDSSTGNVISGISLATAADGTLQLRLSKVTVATSQDLSDLIDRMDAAEDDIDALESAVTTINGDVNTSGSILNAVDTARQALLGNETTYITLKTIGDAIRGLLTDMTTATSDIEDLQDDVSDLEPRVEALEDAVDILNGDANTSGSVANQVSAAVTALINNAPASFDTLKEIADWIQTHGNEAAALITRLSDAEDDIEALEGRMDTAEDDIDTLESGLSTANTNITNLQTAVNTLNGNSSTVGSVEYKISQANQSILTRLSDVEDQAEEAIERLTWQEF